MTYIHTAKDELYDSIEKAQNTELLERVRKMQKRYVNKGLTRKK